MPLRMGDQTGEILAHGLDRMNGLPFAWFRLILGQEEATAKVYLASDKGEAKDATAKRMARQTLRLCGFDIDGRDLDDLDVEPACLLGNHVPVCVSKSPDGRWTNVDIREPRGVRPEQAKSLTASLRSLKSKDEKPMAATPVTTPSEPYVPSSGGSSMTLSESEAARAKLALENEKDRTFDDVPFVWIAAMLSIVGGTLFA